ncbi:MAG: Maf-like protein [Marinifilaceae bacterium]
MRYNIILASNSPRRKELLSGLGIPFTVKVKDTDENYPANLPTREIAIYLSKLKADAFKGCIADNELIITADTVVATEDRVLMKPCDREAAIEMLQQLSGRAHNVITGVTLATKEWVRSFDVVTKVYFDVLSPQQIAYYVDNFKPYDKAGAYGIQEWIGYVGISGIEGSYYNVMGLPVHVLFKELEQLMPNELLQ